jgi:hypothetical protein
MRSLSGQTRRLHATRKWRSPVDLSEGRSLARIASNSPATARNDSLSESISEHGRGITQIEAIIGCLFLWTYAER